MKKEMKVEGQHLTDREKAAVCFSARNAYEVIKEYFYEEGLGDMHMDYMDVVTSLNAENKEKAHHFIGLLVMQSGHYALMGLIEELCDPCDESIAIFMKEFLDKICFDLLCEEDDEGEDEDEGEEPAAEVKVSINGEKLPKLMTAAEQIFKLIGIMPPSSQEKESEESE